MDFSYVIEFLQLKSFTLAVEFQIELKEFKQFSRQFKTDKYINTTEWETIIRKIEETLDKFNKCHEKDAASGNFTTDDDSLAIDWRFKPKSECCINFDKLKLGNCFDWMMHIEIRRAQVHNILDQKPNTPDFPHFLNSDNEYEPTCGSKPYKASKKSDKAVEKNMISHEYSPKPLTSPDSNKKGLNYTPSKIGSKRKISLRGGGDGIFDDDISDESDDGDFEKKIKSSRVEVSKTKRKSQDDSPKKNPFSSTKKTKKMKSGDLNNFVIREPSKTSSRQSDQITVRNKVRKMSTKTTTDVGNVDKILTLISEEDVKKMNKFAEGVKIKQEALEKRREELENLEVLDCRRLSDQRLKSYIDDFASKIKQFYAKRQPSSNIKKAKYDPVLMTTSDVLSESQISFVMKQVELLKSPEERSRNDDLFLNLILPELLIHIFGQEHNLNYEETVQRLKVQDERRTLFNDSS